MLGLMCGHEYSLFDAVELKDKDGKSLAKLLKIRNPWGYNRYSGPWNVDDKNWTPELFAQTDWKKNPERTHGVFYMPVKDFTRIMSTWTLGMY